MMSADTNILFAAMNAAAVDHETARAFLEDQRRNSNFVICELVLTELYLLLRTPAVMNPPLEAPAAAEVIQRYRHHPRWRLVENAPVMDDVWKRAVRPSFARRKLFDIRLAFTLLHHGVEDFATANLSDFKEVGFKTVWNPLKKRR